MHFDLDTSDGVAGWLAARRQHITATDVPLILGYAPQSWGGPLTVYLDKIGQYTKKDSREMAWGRRLEGVVAHAYAETTGRAVAPPPETFWKHPVFDWLGASVDRVTDVNGERRIVELKTAAQRDGAWGEEGTDEVPLPYLLQVQTQMLVSDFHTADLGVLFGGNDFRVYTIPRNDKLMTAIHAASKDFWRLVQAKQPPALDYSHPDAVAMVSALYPTVRKGPAVTLDGDTLGMVQTYNEARERELAAKKLKNQAKAALLERMRDASKATCGDFSLTRRFVRRSGYVVNPTEYVQFSVSDLKDEE